MSVAPPLRAVRGSRLLPPPARPRDWIPAGLAAGLCLSATELLSLAAQDVALPPRQALALAALDAVTVGALCVPVALATRLAGMRTSHSALVGGVVGALLGARALPLLLPPAPALGEGAAGLAAALAGGTAAAWAGGRLESSGVPISGPPLWLAVSLLLVGTASLRRGGPFEPTPAAFLALAAAVVLLALLAAFLAAWAARREAVVPWPWSRLVVALALGAGAVALAPRILPWLVMEPPETALRPTSPNLVLADLGSFPAGLEPSLGGDTPSETLTLLATHGTFYRRFLPGPEAGPWAWLRLEDGLPVARALEARGYRTRAIGPPGAPPPGFGGEGPTDRDAAMSATLGGALLVRIAGSPGRGDDGSAAALAAEARRRIASARALEPDRPLFLVVDFSDAPRDVARIDAALGSVVGLLGDLDLDDDARIGVVWREEAQGGGVRARAVVRPEREAAAARGRIVEMPVLGPELAGVVSGLTPADALLPPSEGRP